MSYQQERDQFITAATKEGLSLPVIRTLLRHASTLQRLAVAQCNGDWPYNGDRDRPGAIQVREGVWKRDEAADARHDKRFTVCPKCESSGVSKQAMRYSSEGRSTVREKVCPDCRTQELVRALLARLESECQHDSKSMLPVPCTCAITPIFGGDPRGAVLRLSTANFPYDESGRGGANGLYVPAREK